MAPNGVDLEQFAAPPRERNEAVTVGMLYRSMPEKGCETALEAVALARRQVPELRLTGFGDRKPNPVPPLLAESSFRWVAEDRELPAIYRACDAWLFPSRREGYGLPILEAMASRTPVIGTPAGAARELAEGGGAMIVPHDDPRAMADAIVRVATMPRETWRSMSDAAYATAVKHTWSHAVDCFEAALVRTHEGAAPPASASPDQGT